jgi:RNA polymerase sigma-70 factor (ECF subfamily)
MYVGRQKALDSARSSATTLWDAWPHSPTTVSANIVGVDATVTTGKTELVDLMIRYQQGDRESVEELVRRLSPSLLRFFFGWSVMREEAEDLLQECWMRIHAARHTYRPSEPVLPWVFGIARHTRLDGYRRNRRRQRREVLTHSPPESYAPQGVSEDPRSERIDKILKGLPESQREVLVMLKVSGMSLEEVARATSSTVGSIKQKAHRAYDKLRILLEGELNR